MFINPIDTIISLGRNVVFTGVSRLQEHFRTSSETLDRLRGAVDTPTNRAMVVGTAATITVLAVHPMTRPALFFFLGMGYSITVITFNLMILGLSAALLLYKAGKMVAKDGAAVAGSVLGGASQVAEQLRREATPTHPAAAAPAAPEAPIDKSPAAAPVPAEVAASVNESAPRLSSLPDEGVQTKIGARVPNHQWTSEDDEALAGVLGVPPEENSDPHERDAVPPLTPHENQTTRQTGSVPAMRLPAPTFSLSDVAQMQEVPQLSRTQRVKNFVGGAVNAVGGPKRIAKGAAIAVGTGVAIFAAYKVYQKLKEVRENGILFEFDPDAEPVVEDNLDDNDLYL